MEAIVQDEFCEVDAVPVFVGRAVPRRRAKGEIAADALPLWRGVGLRCPSREEEPALQTILRLGHERYSVHVLNASGDGAQCQIDFDTGPGAVCDLQRRLISHITPLWLEFGILSGDQLDNCTELRGNF